MSGRTSTRDHPAARADPPGRHASRVGALAEPARPGICSLGETAAARELAHADLELARRVGAPWVIGRGLRLLAELESDARRLELAREAVARLGETSARLELAKAQMLLAGALSAAGNEADARAAWSHAHELALACGAASLAGEAARSLDASSEPPPRRGAKR